MNLPIPVPAVWCLVAAALFGASTPVASELLRGAGPVTLAGLFYLGAALGSAPLARAGHADAPRRREDLPRLLGAVIFGGVLGPVLVLLGLQLAPAASVALWLNLEAPATALLGWAFFQEHMDRRAWGAAGLVWVASVLLAAPAGFSAGPAALLVAAGCLCWGVDNNLTAIIAGYTPAQTTFVKGIIAGAFNLALGLALEGPVRSGAVALALAVGVLSYGASIGLYVAGAQQLGASRAQMIFATAPFWGVALSWLAFGETAQAAQLLAALLMASALALLFTSRHAHEHSHAPMRHTHWHRHDDGHHDAHGHGALRGWHCHAHEHLAQTHTHAHEPDLHHRHEHARVSDSQQSPREQGE